MMKGVVLILGGYGNFGKRIAEALVRKDIPVIIAGRNEAKARALASSLSDKASIAIFDVHASLAEQLYHPHSGTYVSLIIPCYGFRSPFEMWQICIAPARIILLIPCKMQKSPCKLLIIREY